MLHFEGNNPSQLYIEALDKLLKEGDKVSPRGKDILEMRPVVFQFRNPLSRTTFVKGRQINPFFQLAECLWILSGRADVEWLTMFNKNMATFSDDGVFFNAPYGERLMSWNQSRANDFVFNPINQLEDVYLKIKNDPDTRQAVALIYNPLFDNINYSGNGGKDTPCNIVLTFKARNNKLDLTVFNRSNDLHWGLFGANLAQFTTILEAVASWLGMEAGTYTQITDSLHIYLDAYGAKCSDEIIQAYGGTVAGKQAQTFFYDTEPRFSSNLEQFRKDLEYYWNFIDLVLSSDSALLDNPSDMIYSMADALKDDYLRMTVNFMFAYRYFKHGRYGACLDIISAQPLSQWKVICSKFIYKKMVSEGFEDHMERLVLDTLPEDAKEYIRG